MIRPHRILTTVAAGVVFAAHASAYTLIRATETSPPLHWPQPIPLQLNQHIGPGLLNVAPGSDPLGAIQRALSKYPAVSAAQFQTGTTSIADGGRDHVSIISFDDTTANRLAFENAGGDSVVGLTLSFFNSSGELVEADLLFNPKLPFTTTLDTDAALNAANPKEFDIEAVATHELGHVIGLHHTGVESATMWPLTSVLQRQLDADDIAGARTLYPVPGNRGTIAGTVTVNGTAAFGAQVVAVAADGSVAASALTLPHGTYTIEQLAPGSYDMYVEPLDGPHSSVPNVPCVRIGNLSGAGLYSNALLTTNFPTSFSNGIAVVAGQTATVDFHLASGVSVVNPTEIGPATVSGGMTSGTVRGIALGVTAGTDQYITVAGPNVDQVPITGVDLGPDITVDPNSRHLLNATCSNGSPFPFLIFRIVVDGAAATGGRSITLTANGQTVELTGGLRVLPAPSLATPTPTFTSTMTATMTVTRSPTQSPTPTTPAGACVGDCDGNRRVTVDELVEGVNIALDLAALNDCRKFDANGDGKVTVDELVRAVNAALNGCG